MSNRRKLYCVEATFTSSLDYVSGCANPFVCLSFASVYVHVHMFLYDVCECERECVCVCV